MLGIGFSLWRAVFLIVTADSEKMDKAGQAFLTTLIADNMIAYAQDKTSSAWTAGYYINNALYRLHHIYSERLSDIKTRYGKPVEHQVNFQTALDIVDDRNELKRIWVLALNAAQEIFTILKDDPHGAILEGLPLKQGAQFNWLESNLAIPQVARGGPILPSHYAAAQAGCPLGQARDIAPKSHTCPALPEPSARKPHQQSAFVRPLT